MKFPWQALTAALLAAALPVSASLAAEVSVTVNKISADGVGAEIGTITLKDGAHGLIVAPNLRDLPPGNHAFHIHKNPNCAAGTKDGRKIAGLQAGGHYDPMAKGRGMKHGMKHGGDMKHRGMKHGAAGKPHGDLPQLTAESDGTAITPVMTDKLKVKQIRGRAIMIHRYGDSDPDKPKGGGPRYACGVIAK